MLHGLPREFARLFNLVFPEDCAVCGEALTSFSRIPVCDHCLEKPEPLVAEYFCPKCRTPFLNEAPLRPDGICALCRTGVTSFQSAYSYGTYDGSLAKLIHLLKYGGVRPLAVPLGALLARALPSGEVFDLIVPIPLHWRKQLRRGFNQSALLAKELSRRTGLRVHRGLRRVKFTTTQTGLTNSMRRTNVSGAFRVRNGEALRGRRILLVDDVLTTGATAAAAASVLRRAGAAYVAVLTLARVDRRLPMLLSKDFSKPQAVASGAP